MYILFSVCDILISVRGGVREGGGWEDRSGEGGGGEDGVGEDKSGEDRSGEDGVSADRGGEGGPRGGRGIKSLALILIQITFIFVIIQFSEGFKTCLTFTTFTATRYGARFLFIRGWVSICLRAGSECHMRFGCKTDIWLPRPFTCTRKTVVQTPSGETAIQASFYRFSRTWFSRTVVSMDKRPLFGGKNFPTFVTTLSIFFIL